MLRNLSPSSSGSECTGNGDSSATSDDEKIGGIQDFWKDLKNAFDHYENIDNSEVKLIKAAIDNIFYCPNNRDVLVINNDDFPDQMDIMNCYSSDEESYQDEVQPQMFFRSMNGSARNNYPIG